MKVDKAVTALNNKKAYKCSSLVIGSFLAFTLSSGGAMAELRMLDDSTMARVTGRAGLTIDIETEVSIAEIEYVDAGSVYTKDFSLTGIGGGLMDNIRATVDISGANETLATGFSDVAQLASFGYFDATEEDVAWAMAEYSDGAGGFGKQYDDGDLVIHVTSQDLGIDFTTPASPADYVSNLDSYKNAVDLHIQEGEFGLRSSDGSVETALTKNFSVEAYLGYLDIIIENNGNGFHDTSSTSDNGKPGNVLLADSYIGIDVKFRVEDLDVDSTNNAMNTIIPRAVTNPYLTLRDMRIHNERGFDTLGSFGFASIESKMAAAKNVLGEMDDLVAAGAPTYVDGHAIYDVNVKWDWDLPHISFGDTGTSIGKVYFTDFHISDTSLVISAH